MKNTKRRFETFSFFEYTDITRHLTKMAKKGWLLEKISNLGWRYRRMEPKNLSFYVAYFPRSSAYDPEPTEEQKTYHEFCTHTGWKLAAANAQMHIFYNEQENPTPIETDPVLKIEAVHSAAQMSYLPTYFVFLLIAIVECVRFGLKLKADLIWNLSSTAYLFTSFAWLILLIHCTVELGGYFIWYARARKAALLGEFAEASNYSCRHKILLVAAQLAFVYWFVTFILLGDAFTRTAGLLILVYIVGLVVIVNGIKELLKRKKTARGTNRKTTVILSFIIAFSLMGAIRFGLSQASENGLFDRREETVPLTVGDLFDIEYDGYHKNVSSDESLLLDRFFLWQFPPYNAENYAQMPELKYTVAEPKLPFVYEICKNTLLNKRVDDLNGAGYANGYLSIDPEPWQAVEVYRVHWKRGFLNKYLLCYKTRMVEISFSWEPTPEQIEIIADIFSGE